MDQEAPKDDLEVALAYLRRQRADIDRRIAALETSRKDTSSILSDIQKWRERAERSQIAADDPTIRQRP